MKQKLVGISTVSSILLMSIVALLTFMTGEFFSAFNVQLLIVLFTLSIVLTGVYLMNSHGIKRNVKLAIAGFGFLIAGFSILVSFNFIDFIASYNWLISFGILYLMLVQLQLLQWGNQHSILIKICSFILILSNLFLVIYFIAKWRYSGISLWIDIAVSASIVSFLIGIFVSKKVDPES